MTTLTNTPELKIDQVYTMTRPPERRAKRGSQEQRGDTATSQTQRQHERDDVNCFVIDGHRRLETTTAVGHRRQRRRDYDWVDDDTHDDDIS